MKRSPPVLFPVLASAAAAVAMAWLKLLGLGVGRVLLEYIFLPLGGFLLWDGFASLARDPARPWPRFIRIGIAATFLTIHARTLLFRTPDEPAAPAAWEAGTSRP